jgi:hypothetical protein
VLVSGIGLRQRIAFGSRGPTNRPRNRISFNKLNQRREVNDTHACVGRCRRTRRRRPSAGRVFTNGPRRQGDKTAYDEAMPSPRASLVAAGVTLLLLRGVLLWLVIPVATCLWIIVRTVGRHRRLKLGQFLGWADLNLTACPTNGATPALRDSRQMDCVE